MSTRKCQIFTDCDLDGAGAYLVFRWFTQSSCSVKVTRVNDVEQDYKSWSKGKNVSDYDIYFLDLDTSSDEMLNLIDKPNVTIYDHHKSHDSAKSLYKHAKICITTYSSTTKLIYNVLSVKYPEIKLTNNQKLLVVLVDDYDSYKFKIPNSYELNCLFWNYAGDRLSKFIEDFDTGFFAFTRQHHNIINFYLKKLANTKRSLNIYTADIPIKGSNYKFISTFADSCINDIADHIIKEHTADIGMVVNTKSNNISFRKQHTCQVDLSKLAQTICETGGGHEYASGGTIGDKFMEFSKIFTQIQ